MDSEYWDSGYAYGSNFAIAYSPPASCIMVSKVKTARKQDYHSQWEGRSVLLLLGMEQKDGYVPRLDHRTWKHDHVEFDHHLMNVKKAQSYESQSHDQWMASYDCGSINQSHDQWIARSMDGFAIQWNTTTAMLNTTTAMQCYNRNAMLNRKVNSPQSQALGAQIEAVRADVTLRSPTQQKNAVDKIVRDYARESSDRAGFRGELAQVGDKYIHSSQVKIPARAIQTFQSLMLISDPSIWPIPSAYSGCGLPHCQKLFAVVTKW